MKLYDELAEWWPLLSDPADCTYITDYSYLLRERDGSVQVESDRHIAGLFPRSDWLRILTEVGFQAEVLPSEH